MRLISRRWLIRSLLFAGATSAAWARFVEPWWFKTSRHRIPLGLGREITLLHLSDFHADPMPLDYLQSAIRSGLAWQPDVICCTGDFITSRWKDWDRYVEILAEMPKVAPTFACLGNHDGGAWSNKMGGYTQPDYVRDILKRSGIQLLENETTAFETKGTSMHLVGLGDWWANAMRPAGAFPTEPNAPTVLLSHNPDTKDLLRDYRWDLMLSGHTHGGQLSLPFIGEPFAPIRDKRYVRGLHWLEDRWLHITSGVGCLHTARFNARPEISLLTLT